MSAFKFWIPCLAFCLSALWVGCSVADGDPIELETMSSPSAKFSSSVALSSSDSRDSSVVADSVARVDSLLHLVDIPGAKLTRNSLEFKVSSFRISATEVTQSLYKKVMGTVPDMMEKGDSVAVANVSWYDAVLFCNELSKMLNLDTAYVHDGNGAYGALKNLLIDYSAKAIRLPTETEWELAYKGETSSKYYWDNEVASDYAYYAQSSGPANVAQFKPNGFGLYDMAGNVAEWVNDWFDAYSSVGEDNPTGPFSGEYKVVRGGGWSDKVTALASFERNKKLPDTRSETIGFRIVYSIGF